MGMVMAGQDVGVGRAALAEQIVREVAELPDRTSPDDWPEAMLVTGDELLAIVVAALASTVQPEQEDEEAVTIGPYRFHSDGTVTSPAQPVDEGQVTQEGSYAECVALLSKRKVEPTLHIHGAEGPPTHYEVGIINAMVEFAERHRLASRTRALKEASSVTPRTYDVSNRTDPSFREGWHEGVSAFRAAIRNLIQPSEGGDNGCELKACPWPNCGGKAALEVDREDFAISRVICTKCGACGPYVSGTGNQEQVRAVQLWNTRPPASGAEEGWRPIEEAPEQGSFLVYSPTLGIGCHMPSFPYRGSATHFRPLPAPPALATGDRG